MNHTVHDNVLQPLPLFLLFGVIGIIWAWWQLRGDNAVHKLWSHVSIMVSQNDEDVTVWKASLLEFNDIHVCHSFPQQLTVV